MSELLLETINETLKKLVADRGVAESRLLAARTKQEQAQRALAVAREEYECAVFARDQAQRKYTELSGHLRSRKDTLQPLWDKLADLGEELRRTEALIVPAYDERFRRETELNAAIGTVAFTEMKFAEVTKQAGRVAEELQRISAL